MVSKLKALPLEREYSTFKSTNSNIQIHLAKYSLINKISLHISAKLIRKE